VGSLFSQLYEHRRYIWRTARAEIRYRYAGTGVGFFWNVLSPLLQVLLFTTVFSMVLALRGRHQWAGYGFFVCTGLFPWASFAEGVTRGSQSLIRNAPYLRTLAVPHVAFVAQSSLVSLFGLLVSLSLLLPVASWQGEPWSWTLLGLLPLALLLHALAFGLSLALSSLRVLFPDVGEGLRLVLQLWMWSLPVVYREAMLPGGVAPWWMRLNPPYVFIQGIRDVLLEQRLPVIGSWGLMLVWVLLALAAGVVVARVLRSEVRDSL
jgi:ABC-type polysaccharide/polyol phosphate export permease